MGWHPETGFIDGRWNHYCELMMIYLLAIGSPTHPVVAGHVEGLVAATISYRALTIFAEMIRSSRTSTHMPGTTFERSATNGQTISKIPSQRPGRTKLSASLIPSGTTRSTGAYQPLITRAATRPGEVHRRKVHWMALLCLAPLRVRWRSFQPTAFRCFGPCGTNGASRRGVAMASLMHSIRQQLVRPRRTWHRPGHLGDHGGESSIRLGLEYIHAQSGDDGRHATRRIPRRLTA